MGQSQSNIQPEEPVHEGIPFDEARQHQVITSATSLASSVRSQVKEFTTTRGSIV